MVVAAMLRLVFLFVHMCEHSSTIFGQQTCSFLTIILLLPVRALLFILLVDDEALPCTTDKNTKKQKQNR